MKNKETIKIIQDMVRTCVAINQDQYPKNEMAGVIEYINELDEIDNDSLFLATLMAVGVNNWDGYEEAIEMLED